jgi:ATP-dependent RNA helicase DHX36
MRNSRAIEMGVVSGCGLGMDKLKQKARTAAKIDLVKRMAPFVKDAEHLMKGRPLDAVPLSEATAPAKAAESKMFHFEFPKDSVEKATKLFAEIQESGLFDQTVPNTFRANSNYKHSTRSYPSYGKEQIESIPSLAIPQNFEKTRHLPIFERYHEILSTIETNQVTVLSAATGSGKTTQVPQFILSLYDSFRSQLPTHISPPSVVCTQPRRIAAISVAQRIAAERNEQMNNDCSVGYLVRFQSQFPNGPKSHSNGKILLCTAGILLKKLQSNPDMTDISHLIIDEVHERDVFSDILLMLSKDILKRRPGLKVILMSATLQSDKFADYFIKDGFRVGRVDDIGGTNYPVDSVYIDELCKQLKAANHFPKSLLPATTSYLQAEANLVAINKDAIIDQEELCEVPIDIVGETIGWLHRTKPPGAILVFLPGWEDITSVQDYLISKNLLNEGPPHKLFVLHSSGPQQVTDDLFYRTPEYRKIILATNIAESSITIPDAVYVVDSGTQKTTFYDAKHRMNVLETCWLSRSNLKQRLGRAGRCQPGTYYSLISKARADVLPSHIPPELARLNLDEVCLGVRAAGVTDPCEEFLGRALDPPSHKAVKESVAELQSIQAFDDQERLTSLGRLLANIPIHPRISKMLVTASLLRCISPIESIVAGMGEKLTRSTLFTEAKIALNAYLRSIGQDLYSDHLTILKVYYEWMRGDRSMCRLFSDTGLQRMNKSRVSIHTTLTRSLLDEPNLEYMKQHHYLLTTHYDRNSANINLLRFVLTSGLYPDVAKLGRRRNNITLAHIKTPVMLSMTSVNALPPTSDGKSDEDQQVKARVAETRRLLAAMPPMYLYEELFDAGTKKVQKTTAIDPIWTALFCKNFEVSPKTGTLSIDNWITLKGSKESINLLTELRHHYSQFIQFASSKRLTGEMLSDEEQKLADSFTEFLVDLVSGSTDIHRKLQ